MNKMTEQNRIPSSHDVYSRLFLNGNLISRARERSERRLRNQRTSDAITLRYLLVVSSEFFIVQGFDSKPKSQLHKNQPRRYISGPNCEMFAHGILEQVCPLGFVSACT